MQEPDSSPAKPEGLAAKLRQGFFGSGDFIPSEFHGQAPARGTPSVPIPECLAIGWEGPPRFGTFEVLELIGRGGMGAVYRARDPEADRELALKVVLTRPGDADRLARFQREGQLTASLEHPGIVRVHSAGDVEGHPWIAYELVPNARPLSDVFAERNRRGRVDLILQAARALGHAHAHGVVHRDVKPDNLLVDGEGRVRVADFGIAWARGVDRLTQTGVFVGTPLYSPPEQLQGKARGGGPASDVWSLGVILYQALTETLPFDGSSLIELMAVATRASPISPRKLDPSISPELEAVCLRALRAKPTDRYPDGDAFADALQIAVLSRRRSTPSRVTLAVGLASLLVVGAALVGLSTSIKNGDTARLPAGRPSGSSAASPPKAPATPASRPDAEALERGSREAKRLQRLPLEEVAAAASAWLAEFPRHPSGDEVHRALQRARYGAPVQTLPTQGEVLQARLLERGKRLVIGALAETRVIDVASRAARPLDAGDVLALTRDRNDGMLLLGPGTLSRMTRRGQIESVADLPPGARCLALSGDGGWLGLGTDGPDALVFDLERREIVRRLGPHEAPVWGVCFLGGRKQLITTGGDASFMRKVVQDVVFRVWDLETRELVIRRPLSGRGEFVVPSADERLLFLGGDQGAVEIFDVEQNFLRLGTLKRADADPFLVVTTHAQPIQLVALAAGGRHLVTVSGGRRNVAKLTGNEFAVWDVETRRELLRRERPFVIEAADLVNGDALGDVLVLVGAKRTELWLIDPRLGD